MALPRESVEKKYFDGEINPNIQIFTRIVTFKTREQVYLPGVPAIHSHGAFTLQSI